jgi:hypothetical protein
MNRGLRTSVASAAQIVGSVALVCVAAAASLVALAAAVGSVRAAHAPGGATTVNGNRQVTGLTANQQIGMYGDPAAAAPFWRLQHSGDCAEMAVADVVGQITGHEPTERQITLLAKSTPSIAGSGPIYQRREGTDITNLPVLLAHYGIQSSLRQPTIGGLEQDLAQQHKVIAAVNAQTIWNTRGNRNADNHVVVVTGIDTRAGIVHLNDSGIRTGRDEQVSLAVFETAWATSDDLAVVTA